ncbi:helix-turn-helix domain-containing protein [Flagellimonas marina]|uniref:Helix-turn-helix domain-containing protein n=1 Tax=Flagellimonas marina TaxID=1775168 RepID=A0ABV8PGJ1_9FLAO
MENKTQRHFTQSMDNLLDIIAQHLNVEKSAILSDCQKERTIYARHTASYVAYELNYGSLKEIGRHLDRNHASILNGKKRIVQWLTYDKKLRRDINAIMTKALVPDQVSMLKYVLGLVPLERLPDFLEHAKEYALTEPVG